MERFYLGPSGPGHSCRSPLLYQLSYRLLPVMVGTRKRLCKEAVPRVVSAEGHDFVQGSGARPLCKQTLTGKARVLTGGGQRPGCLPAAAA